MKERTEQANTGLARIVPIMIPLISCNNLDHCGRLWLAFGRFARRKDTDIHVRMSLGEGEIGKGGNKRHVPRSSIAMFAQPSKVDGCVKSSHLRNVYPFITLSAMRLIYAYQMIIHFDSSVICSVHHLNMTLSHEISHERILDFYRRVELRYGCAGAVVPNRRSVAEALFKS